MTPALLLVVTGGRALEGADALRGWLTRANPAVVAHGDCPTGADRIASEWAEANHVPQLRVAAPWDAVGRSAGPRRNGVLLKCAVIYAEDFGLRMGGLVAPGGKGTADMAARLKSAGIKVWEPKR